MKKPFAGALLILLVALISIYTGCTKEAPSSNVSTTPTVKTEAPYWATENGVFYTKDFDRAQKEIPFLIILPDYFPSKQEEMLLPDIKGPLRESQINGEIEIEIRYTLQPGLKDSGLIRIFETNLNFTLGDPELNPRLEVISIRNNQVLKIEQGDLGLGPGIWFSFNSNNIYFVVEIYNLPTEEAIKIVESMIKQIE